MSEPAMKRSIDRADAAREVAGRAPAPAPAPKPVASAPRQALEPRAARVPAAGELLDPAGEPSLEGADAATLTAIIGSYVRQVYDDFQQAHTEAFIALHEPPPPADRPFALVVLEKLVGALAAYATGGLASLVFQAAGDKLGSDARAALSKALSGMSGAVAKALAAQAPTQANPAAVTLLAEFQSRQASSLREQRYQAERQLLVASAAMRAADPGALRGLAEALARRAGASALRAEYISRVGTGWLQLCSAISLGPRRDGEPAMPDANRVGGSASMEWRRAHAGFVEIEVDFPEEVDGLIGVGVGKIRVAGGPGAARILRQGGGTLGDLAVYRRLWLGAHRLDRAPDVVIAPDQRLEVNAHSALLAAIAVKRAGRLSDLAAEGRGEEHERARLLEKRARTAAPPAPHEPGRLGPLVDGHRPPAPGERTEEEQQRLIVLGMRRRMRAAAALEGARALWAWIGATSTARVW